jgi:uncharacterized protein (TIGR02284 family)
MESTNTTPVTNSAETIEVLNDLLTINNDRVVGYERALGDVKSDDTDLKSLFTSMIDESRKIRIDLAGEVQALGGEFEAGTTASGKIHRAWMDVKAVFTGHDRHEVLANCEQGEDATQTAYKHALAENKLPAYIRTMVESQKSMLKASHDRIKALRDASKH